MRSEKEMMDLILGFAKNDERVRVVTMEGSRMNRNAPRDRFQDYDISFYVTGVESYVETDDWLDVFGRRIIMQKPQSMAMFPPEPGKQQAYLMLYEDGNRIDLTLNPLDEFDIRIKKADSQTKVLLDKDGLCPPLPEPSDRDYHVRKPSAEFVDDCCNEFWWLSTYVAKGLCRNEMLYALHHLELMQKQLLTMVSWKAGAQTGYTVSVGKSCKYLEKFVSPAMWGRILQSYGAPSAAGCWKALRNACALFREVSAEVAAGLGYRLPPYGDKVGAYLDNLRREEGLADGSGT
ncbi:MAG: aminoglycoside 6-adenylyltransferase [Treponema sp.]|jgi:aminoglycoside 6-adenylyltransferase|nr:aminoglycoside 6-adenylyltransferase [Treponema sp.]